MPWPCWVSCTSHRDHVGGTTREVIPKDDNGFGLPEGPLVQC